MHKPGLLLLFGATLLALAGCGGGGNDDTDTGTDTGGGGGGGGGGAGGGSGSRQAALSYDFDNNGVADATLSLVYDSSGRVVERRFVRSGNTSSDKFDPYEEATSGVETLAYDSQSRLISTTSGGGQFNFIYDGAAVQATRADIFAGGDLLGSWAYTYAGSLLTQASRSGIFGTSRDTYTHDAQGRRLTALEAADSADPLLTSYTWNSDNQLSQVDREFDADGGPVRYTMTHVGGRQATTVKTVSGVTSYSVAFSYDGDGRLVRAEFDDGADGTVNAVWSVTWETGACAAVRMTEFDPLLDSISGHGATTDGTLSPCAP